MSHRAVVAYERSRGRYDLHRSRDGASSFVLAESLSAERPFGGDLASVDRDPFAIGVELTELLEDHLNFLTTEALYRVDRGFGVRSYLPLWFGLDVAVEQWPAVGFGALVALRRGREYREARRYRPWFEGARATLGTLRPGERQVGNVGRHLERVVRRWLATDREVHVAIPDE